MAKVAILTPSERRAKREARRAQQRQANVGRSLKMHTARVADQNAPGRPCVSGMRRKAGDLKPRFHIGCSGWFYWDWRGRFYPEHLPTNQWFQHYANHFKTVELNAPFYSWPTVATVKSWLRQAGRRKFIYTVKVCELITHVKRFAGTKGLI